MKKILHITLWVFIGSIIVVLLSFVNGERKNLKCKSVAINITPINQFFVESNDIKRIIPDEQHLLKEKPFSMLNLAYLEGLLAHNPYIEKAEVYVSINGKLNIDINQVMPILRIIDKSYHSYYINEKGSVLPLSSKYTSRVLVATGNIPTRTVNANESSQELFSQLYFLAFFINNNEFWKAQIEHINVNVDAEFELIPRVGNHRILLGRTENLEEKFTKLMAFYKNSLKKVDWNQYSTINLKYKDQIVCSRHL